MESPTGGKLGINREKLIYFCDKILSASIVALIFSMPLFFNLEVNLNFQKAYFFRMIVELIFFFFLARAVIGREVRIKRNNLFYLALASVFFAYLAATVFSAHPYVSFWGSYARQMGLFTWIHLLAFSFITYNFFGKKDLEKLLAAVAISGALSALYAVLQAGGFDFISWDQARDGWQSRPGGTLGQPNFLAAVLLYSLPASFYLAIKRRDRRERIFYALSIVIQSTAFILTYSRAAWLALIATSLIFFFSYLWRGNRKLFYAGFPVIALIVISAFFYGTNAGWKSWPVVERMRSAMDFQEGSVGMRRLYYTASMAMIKASPLIGYGLDTQYYHFYRYYDRNYPLFERINAYADRAHSEILDIFLTSGVLGVAAWGFLWAGLAMRLAAWSKNGAEDDTLPFVLSFSLLSVAFAVTFGFFTETDALYFWLFVALISIRLQDGKEIAVPTGLRPAVGHAFLGSMALALMFIAWHGNVKPQIADHYYLESKTARDRGDFNLALELSGKAINYSPGEIFFRNRFVIENLPIVLSIPDTEERLAFLNHLASRLEETGDRYFNFESRAYRGILFSEIGKLESSLGTGSDRKLGEAEEIFTGLIGENPERARLFLDYGTTLLYMGEYGKAMEQLEKAIALYPDLNDKRMNDEHRNYVSHEKFLVLKKMIEVSLASGDGKIFSLIDEAARLYPYDLDLWDMASRAYMASGQTDKIVEKFEHLAVIFPDNDNILHLLANIYIKEDKLSEAEASIRKALSIKPQEARYSELLRAIKNRYE